MDHDDIHALGGHKGKSLQREDRPQETELALKECRPSSPDDTMDHGPSTTLPSPPDSNARASSLQQSDEGMIYANRFILFNADDARFVDAPEPDKAKRKPGPHPNVFKKECEEFSKVILEKLTDLAE